MSIAHPTLRQAQAVRASIARHEANVTECLWKDGVCQVRAGLLLAVHDSQNVPSRYRTALRAWNAHSCGPMPSMELQEGAEVPSDPQ